MNEYISEEDMKRYEMEEKYYSFKPGRRRSGGPSSAYRFNWTIDRDKEVYIYRGKLGSKDDSGHSYWLLNIAGDSYRVHTVMEQGCSGNLNDNPFIIVWGLIEVNLYENAFQAITPNKEMIQVLKEALTAYGYDGIIDQVDNTIVNFNF